MLFTLCCYFCVSILLKEPRGDDYLYGLSDMLNLHISIGKVEFFSAWNAGMALAEREL